MTAETQMPGRPKWATGPLYKKMLEIFPEHLTPLGVLDIQRLKVELEKSHEAIYKWLRQGKISPDNARDLIKVAALPENAAILAKHGRPAPVFEDFVSFF